jgi:hypothetical protein
MDRSEERCRNGKFDSGRWCCFLWKHGQRHSTGPRQDHLWQNVDGPRESGSQCYLRRETDSDFSWHDIASGSIHQGDLLTEQFTTQPNEFQALMQPDGTTVNLVNDGAATVTLSNPNGSVDTFLLPNLPSGFLQHSVLRFLHR